MKRSITLFVIFVVLLFLSSCIFFQQINQPSVSAPNTIVSVTIIASTQGGSYEPYFGVCLPVGWSVPGDSIQCGGAYEEAIHYDTLISSWQESVSPAPAGYYWWAGKGIPNETAIGNVFANLKIQTDNQLGEFSIDYMLGDGYNGVNYERSEDHLIEITTEPLILFVNPEEGYQNFTLDMNILGLNTHFSDGTGTENVWLSKDGNEIYANSFIVNNNTSIDANFSIPLTAQIGLWDVNVETDIDGIIAKSEGFNILPSPPIIAVSPDSLVVGVLPGSTKTKILTISNEGETNLSFNIIGGFSSTNDALLFDGTDDYVHIDYSLNRLPLTVEMWFYMTALATYAGRYDGVHLFSNDNPSEYGFGLCVSKDENYLGIQRHDDWEFSNIIVPLFEWHHASVVYQDGQFKLFWDSNLVLENSYGQPPLNGTDYFWLGGNTAEPWAWQRFFTGIIDEVRVWDVARTQTEIQQFMYKQITGSEPGLVGYWQLNEGTGNTTFDRTLNANHGTLFGGVQWSDSSAPILPGWFFLNQDSGVCLPHTSMDIELLFDATEVDTGDYYASVIVKSNDPFTPSVIIPIHMIVSPTVGIDDGLEIPLAFNLYQNYPNPFNPSTIIKYSVSELSKVKITLFNLLGEEVTTLVNEEKNKGNYSVEFNASSLPSGVYFYQLKAGEFLQTKKMLLLK